MHDTTPQPTNHHCTPCIDLLCQGVAPDAYVCFELLDGDVLDLIGEFLGGGQVPQFAMTCRTLYRGLLEYKIENYALQEEMLKEQVEELHEEGAYNRVHLARGLLSLGGGG